MLHSTSGGFSDTELKLLTVMPSGVPSGARVVMMVTPVAKLPSALRKSIGSKATPLLLMSVSLWSSEMKTDARRRPPEWPEAWHREAAMPILLSA